MLMLGLNRILADIGTFHGCFDPQFLQRYLDGYVFRFNRRTCKAVRKLFWLIMQPAAQSTPIARKKLRLPRVSCLAVS